MSLDSPSSSKRFTELKEMQNLLIYSDKKAPSLSENNEISILTNCLGIISLTNNLRNEDTTINQIKKYQGKGCIKWNDSTPESKRNILAYDLNSSKEIKYSNQYNKMNEDNSHYKNNLNQEDRKIIYRERYCQCQQIINEHESQNKINKSNR